MRLSYVSTVLGVFAIGLWGCSSSEHQLGESPGGTGGGGNVGGDSARGGSTDAGGALNQAGAPNHAGAPSGGSSGNGNVAGESAAGASTDGGASNGGARNGGAGNGGAGNGGLEAACTQSGGTVTSSLCCSTTDFANQCSVGACGCAPTVSHQVKVCNCPVNTCFDGHSCSPR
ncbi:MAG: hypothetical protein ABIQ16_11395 [Polyangiaceae bacterium]